jgi:uncharacterized protein (DUF488 family)
MTVFTIGYEGLDIDTFVSMLAEYNIETVVDIRELPLSRKRGFSKTALTGVLNLSGLEYVHMARRAKYFSGSSRTTRSRRPGPVSN